MAVTGLSRRAFAALALATPFSVAPFAMARAQEATPPLEAATSAATGENRNQQITAQVFVDEQGPFTFLVDTGANRSAISERLAARLGLAGGKPVEVNTVLGAWSRPTVTVGTLRIGDHTQRGVEIPTLALGGDADGILGVDWLTNRRLTFYFAERRLMIEPSMKGVQEAAAPGGSPILMPARLKSGQLSLIDAAVADRSVAAMIDTGAQFTLGNRALQTWARRRFGASVQTETISIATVTGEKAAGEVMYLPNLRLGAARFDHVPVVFSDIRVFKLWDMERQPALVLGLDVIGLFDAVALDFGNRVVRLDPPPTARMVRAEAR